MEWKNWKLWVMVAILAAMVIAAVVCHLVQPKVTYAWLEVVSAFTFVIGCSAGALVDNYLVKKGK